MKRSGRDVIVFSEVTVFAVEALVSGVREEDVEASVRSLANWVLFVLIVKIATDSRRVVLRPYDILTQTDATPSSRLIEQGDDVEAANDNEHMTRNEYMSTCAPLALKISSTKIDTILPYFSFLER